MLAPSRRALPRWRALTGTLDAPSARNESCRNSTPSPAATSPHGLEGLIAGDHDDPEHRQATKDASTQRQASATPHHRTRRTGTCIRWENRNYQSSACVRQQLTSRQRRRQRPWRSAFRSRPGCAREVAIAKLPTTAISMRHGTSGSQLSAPASDYHEDGRVPQGHSPRSIR